MFATSTSLNIDHKNHEDFANATSEEKVQWAAKILMDYTKLSNNRVGTGIERSQKKLDLENGQDNVDGSDEDSDNLYQMCYMPIVLACIVIGALMIGLVIYFVEGSKSWANKWETFEYIFYDFAVAYQSWNVSCFGLSNQTAGGRFAMNEVENTIQLQFDQVSFVKVLTEWSRSSTNVPV